MTFITSGAVTATPDAQKAAFDAYINNDKYLKTRRGQYAERNASRTEFTNVVDLRLAQDFTIKLGNKKYSAQVIYSMMNFSNFLNRDWGRQFFASFDQFQLLSVSYAANSLVPRYTFNPTTGRPGSVTTTVTPSYSSRWNSQLEFRIRF